MPASELTIPVNGGTLEVSIVPAAPRGVTEQELRAWVETSARAVAAYYGAFPVSRVRLRIRAGGASTISSGRTNGSAGEASIQIGVGDAATAEDLRSSWVLVHEMVHLAFPSMTGHAWIEEGLATYVEPLIRARAGLIASDEIWRWLLWGAPRGLDAIRDEGLEQAGNWAATYWGGAAFCLLADVEIRERTSNRASLDDALRGIVRAGGNVTASWPIAKAFEVGDQATGVPVLRELYARMGRSPADVKLQDLWKRLGVSAQGSRVVYDDSAPLAAIRLSITSGKSLAASRSPSVGWEP
jgi:hypothetical protein